LPPVGAREACRIPQRLRTAEAEDRQVEHEVHPQLLQYVERIKRLRFLEIEQQEAVLKDLFESPDRLERRDGIHFPLFRKRGTQFTSQPRVTAHQNETPPHPGSNCWMGRLGRKCHDLVCSRRQSDPPRESPITAPGYL